MYVYGVCTYVVCIEYTPGVRQRGSTPRWLASQAHSLLGETRKQIIWPGFVGALALQKRPEDETRSGAGVVSFFFFFFFFFYPMDAPSRRGRPPPASPRACH